MRPDEVAPCAACGAARAAPPPLFDVETLDPSITGRIPDGVDLILICSPTGRFQPFEEELLRQYLTTRPAGLTIGPVVTGWGWTAA